MTPERTIPDQISIIPEMEKQMRHNNPTMQHRGANSVEEDEEDEEEGMNVYMDRGADLSCSESSCQNSGNVPSNRTLAASGDSGTAEVEEPEFEVADEGLGQDEGKAGVEELSFISEGRQTGVQGHVTGVGEEEGEEEVFDSSGNVDLFSVQLASLPVRAEEEEAEEEEEAQTRDFLTDLLKLSDLEPLMLTVSQPESDDQTAVALMLPTQEDCVGRRADTLSGYLKTCDDETQHEKTQEQEEEEEEEEEEFSGYMKHT
ncbi:hypothetical protein GBF38_018139 [Nibea albiflora]|uniref:Uncharacterized protein n=1 Tax=Nibea albiflora TaxID=240163 RepID=A0ACB7EGI4_NIBAL|nr:hypothetical protein GBF38_018139 [Nibea albiflora]